MNLQEQLIDDLQEILDMQEKVMREHNGRPDCKNCSLAEVIQERLNKAKAAQILEGKG